MKVRGLKAWSDKLRTQDMPVLSDVITELNKITGSDDTDVNQLAEVILRDPNLTSNILKIANSVHYNYSKNPINTVSRAIVNMGLKGVRALCISMMVVDSLVKGQPKDRVMQLVAQGFHAGTQAKRLAESLSHDEQEEAFIAGLLFNMGEMAFWTNENVKTDNEALMSENPKTRRAAMEKVLGTSFKAITRELGKHWKLGDTLEQALYPASEPTPAVKAVILGERLSRAALYGWESPQVRKVLGEVCEHTGLSVVEALEHVKKGGDQASTVAEDYGVAEVCPLIPNSTKDYVIRHEANSKIMYGDSELQLNILRDLINAAEDDLNVNTIFQMVIEGMHRGVGLERVCIAFNKNRRLEAKYMLGEATDHWRNRFNFDVGPFNDTLFTESIEKGGSQWITKAFIKKNPYLYADDITTVVGKFPAFIHVVEISGRKAGLFYADRCNYGGELTQDKFESFKHFCSQAESSLAQLSPPGRSSKAS